MSFDVLSREIERLQAVSRYGTVHSVLPGSVTISGLGFQAKLGDLVQISGRGSSPLGGEIIALANNRATAMVFANDAEIGIGDPVKLMPRMRICPTDAWKGRIIDAFGEPMDGRPLANGTEELVLRRGAPNAGLRRGLGARLHTGLAVTDTFLPLARGQRIGIFAGSGVGKTSMLGDLARHVEADVVVLGLIGERGRELREFTENVLGEEGLSRSVVVASTSDQSPLLKRRAAWMATAIAEVFRDQGKHVLLIIDSLTRFAESHREIALTAGEAASLRAFPPSTANVIAALTERAGTGEGQDGDITAVYSVLVAGSDMEEPVADFARGVLDGHIVLDRNIAERGRFPAIDVGRSVSRSLPDCASEEEVRLLSVGRRIMNVYSDAETLVRTGLYNSGSDPEIDAAIKIWPQLDRFIEIKNSANVEESFEALQRALVTAAE